MKTQTEIDSEVARLKEIRDKVPARTAFGDDNRAAIDAQIEVLESRMSEGDIYDRWWSAGDDDVDPDPEFDHALDAHRWAEGTSVSTQSPSEEWAELLD